MDAKSSVANTLENQARVLGLKIAVFINSLNLTLEQKEAFFEVLKSYSLAELEDLASLLEAVYLEAKTDGAAEINLKKSLQKIKNSDNAKTKRLLEKASAQFDAIEDFFNL